MRKHLIGLLVVLLGSGMGWAVFRLEHLPASPPPTTPATSPPAVEFQGVNLIEFANGAKLWDLDAQHVQYDSDHQVADLEKIRARFWEHGRVVSTAQAPEATLETSTRNLLMKGGISVVSQDANTHLSARQVEWIAASQSLHASGDVTFQRGPSRLTGPELWGDRSLERIRMGKDIQAHVLLDTGWK